MAQHHCHEASRQRRFRQPKRPQKGGSLYSDLQVVDAVVIGFKNTAEIDGAVERINRALTEVLKTSAIRA
jgi:hypothetical protein